MTNELIITLISAFGALIGAFSGTRLMNFRIKRLEERIEKLDDTIKNISIVQTQVKEIYSRLSNIERLIFNENTRK